MMLQKTYTWQQWRCDYEDELWQVYHALTRSTANIPILDCLSYHDFVTFCIKNTHEPVAPIVPDCNDISEDECIGEQEVDVEEEY